MAEISNTGGRALDLSGTLKLTEGPGGLSAGPFPASLGTSLGVGETEPITILLDKQLPNGPWKARIEVVSGLLTRTANADLTFPNGTGTGETVQPKAESSGVSPWVWIAAGALLLALLALIWWLVARRRRREPAEINDPAVPTPTPTPTAV
jgi:hypothetical protein